jgi:hypothetical protein
MAIFRHLPVLAVLAIAAVLMTGCTGATSPELAAPSVSSTPSTPATPASSLDPSASQAGLRPCQAYETIAAPESAYRATPVYVANEMPAEEVQAWARSKAGFETM